MNKSRCVRPARRPLVKGVRAAPRHSPSANFREERRAHRGARRRLSYCPIAVSEQGRRIVFSRFHRPLRQKLHYRQPGLKALQSKEMKRGGMAGHSYLNRHKPKLPLKLLGCQRYRDASRGLGYRHLVNVAPTRRLVLKGCPAAMAIGSIPASPTIQSRQTGRCFLVHKNPRNFGPTARRVAVCEPNSDRSPAFCA